MRKLKGRGKEGVHIFCWTAVFGMLVMLGGLHAQEVRPDEFTVRERRVMQVNAEEQREAIRIARELLGEMEQMEEEAKVYAWVMKDLLHAMEKSATLLESRELSKPLLNAQEDAVAYVQEMLNGLKTLQGHLMEHFSGKSLEQPKPGGEGEMGNAGKVERKAEDRLLKLRDELALLRIRQVSLKLQVASARHGIEVGGGATRNWEGRLQELEGRQSELSRMCRERLISAHEKEKKKPVDEKRTYSGPPNETAKRIGALAGWLPLVPMWESYEFRFRELRGFDREEVSVRQIIGEALWRLNYVFEKVETGLKIARKNMGEHAGFAGVVLTGVIKKQKQVEEELTALVMLIGGGHLGRELESPPSSMGAGGSEQQTKEKQKGAPNSDPDADPASDEYDDRWKMRHPLAKEPENQNSIPWGRLPERLRDSLLNNMNETMDDPRYNEWFKNYTRALQKQEK